MSGAGVAAAKARIQREFAAVHADLTSAFSELDLTPEVVDEELGGLQFTPESESVELVDFEEDTNATLASEMARCEQATPTPVSGGSELYTFIIDGPISESYQELIALAMREMPEDTGKTL